MEDSFSHLSPTCKILMEGSDAARIDFIHHDRWINHEIGSQIRKKINSSLFLPRNSQALCMLIIGIGGAGKSSLLDRVIKDCESWAQRHGEPLPYLQLTLPPEPTLKTTISALCERFDLTTSYASKGSLPVQFQFLLKTKKIRGLFIDEFNHVLAANRVEVRKLLNFFKNLSGPPWSLDLIAFGTNEAMHAVKMDIQLSSRFQIFEIPLWSADEEFRAFLATYEKYLPLARPSNLASREIVTYLTKKLEPTTRNIINRLKWAAMTAVVEGAECITLDILDRSETLPDLLSVYENESNI